MAGKQDKMHRDKVDYESNTVYSWKKPVYTQPRRHRTNKRVSFSDLEAESANDTLAVTNSNSSPEASGNQGAGKRNPNPQTLNKGARSSTKKKRRDGRGQEGEEGDTANGSRYQLRNRH